MTQRLPTLGQPAVSLVESQLISLPLEHGPFYVYITISFACLVKDSDPNTTKSPSLSGAARADDLPASFDVGTKL